MGARTRTRRARRRSYSCRSWRAVANPIAAHSLEETLHAIWLLIVIAEKQDADGFGVAKGKGSITNRSRGVLNGPWLSSRQ